MTREEFYDLIEKYNLEVNGNYSIIYKKYVIGYLQLKINRTNPNGQYSFSTNDTSLKWLVISNPIAADNKIKHIILEIKKTEISNRLSELNKDFI